MQKRWYLTSIGRCYKVSASGLKRGSNLLKSVWVAKHVEEDDGTPSIYGISVLSPKVVVASEESEHRKSTMEDNYKPSKDTQQHCVVQHCCSYCERECHCGNQQNYAPCMGYGCCAPAVKCAPEFLLYVIFPFSTVYLGNGKPAYGRHLSKWGGMEGRKIHLN